MKKLLLILSVLSISIAAVAADGKTKGADNKAQASTPAAKSSPKAASTPPAASAPAATEARAAAKASKQRSTKMAACRKEATDKGLRDVELKSAIAACANQ
jgi:hypothetical protein